MSSKIIDEIFRNHRIDLKKPKFDIAIVMEMMYDAMKAAEPPKSLPEDMQTFIESEVEKMFIDENGAGFKRLGAIVGAIVGANLIYETYIVPLMKDMEDAAGELMVELPQPGTVIAKLLHANVMLRKYGSDREQKLREGTANVETWDI